MVDGDGISTDFLLRQWGLWARTHHGLQLSHPSVSVFARMQPRPSSGLVIDDREALQVDALVSALRRVSEQEHDVLARHYVAGQPARMIARELGWRDHRRVLACLANGRRFIEGVIYGVGLDGAPETG